MNNSPIAAAFALLALAFAFPRSAESAIVLGLLNDFESGTTEGWAGGASPVNISTGGPTGAGDNFLRIGNGGNLASFNTGTAFSGAIASPVTAFQADLMRPAIESSALDIRLALFGPGTDNRWTSAVAQVVPNDGVWRIYTFPLLEADLVRVLGAGTYASLAADVERIKFQHDPLAPSSNGASAPGTLGLDNIRAIPEPATPLVLAATAGIALLRRRRSAPLAN